MASPYQVRVIQTYASNITGGVTSGTTYSHIGSRRKLGTPTPGEEGLLDVPVDPTGNCKCEWVWDDEKQAWVCIHCGSVMTDDQYYDGHFHDGQCPCPLPLDWTAILFLLALTCAYVTYKETKKSRA